jgi:hypothetical protein
MALETSKRGRPRAHANYHLLNAIGVRQQRRVKNAETIQLAKGKETRDFLDSIRRETITGLELSQKLKGWLLEYDEEKQMPRLFAVLTRLYDLSILGDIDAMKLLFDRVLGKQIETTVQVSAPFESLSNADILAQFKAKQNIVQSTIEQVKDVKLENPL